MTHEELLEYALKKKGAYVDYPFGDDVTCVKVKKRIFLQLFFLKGLPKITVSGDVMTNEFYRRLYPESVVRGYHCPQVQRPYFNTVSLDGKVEDDELKKMLDISYARVVSKLTKKAQKELEKE